MKTKEETLASVLQLKPKDDKTCHAFLHCRNPATTTLDTVKGKIHACQRCANRLAPARVLCGKGCNCKPLLRHSHVGKP